MQCYFAQMSLLKQTNRISHGADLVVLQWQFHDSKWIGLSSVFYIPPQTQYRLYGRRLGNQQYQSTEGTNVVHRQIKHTISRHEHKTANSLVYNNMVWLGDGSHRGQGCQAWTAVGLPPHYPPPRQQIASDLINNRTWRLVEHGFTSAPTQYRLYGRRFLQVWWPNQQCQSTERGWWLVIETGLNLTMLTSPCYNTTTCMQLLQK